MKRGELIGEWFCYSRYLVFFLNLVSKKTYLFLRTYHSTTWRTAAKSGNVSRAAVPREYAVALIICKDCGVHQSIANLDYAVM